MATPEKDFKPGIINILNCKCPRCRRGDMYVHGVSYNLNKFMKMNETCSVCGQVFDIEVGFYYGTSYVSYGITIVFSVITFILWWLIIGISVDDNRVIYWLIINGIIILALQPFFMRIARTVWLSFFVPYDPNWRENPAKAPERINPDQKDAW